MRKSIVFLITVAFAAVSVAQVTLDLSGQGESIAAMTKEAVREKASKIARRDAKSMTKDGWKVAPGQLPLEKQLDRSYEMQYLLDDEMQPLYLTGDAMSVAETYDVAKMQADDMAKSQIAGKITSHYTSLIERKMSNDQISQSEAKSVSRIVSDSRSIVEGCLVNVLPVVECYRTQKNGNIEVRVMYACNPNSESMLKSVRQNVMEALKDNPETARIVEQAFDF